MTVKLDAKDRKLLALLDENSRYTNTQLAKKVALSKPAVEYRIKRLLTSKVISQFYTVIDFTRLGYAPYKLYFKFQDVTLEEEGSIADYWTASRNAIWVGKTRGRWDLAVTILAKSSYEFGRILGAFNNKYSRFILEKDVFLIEYSPIYAKSGDFVYGTPTDVVDIDDIDRKILKEISTDARISVSDIASKTHLTRDVITYRMKKLVKDGVIAQFRCFTDTEVVGTYFAKVLIRTKNLDEKEEMRLNEYVRQKKEAVQLLKIIGSTDLELEFETAAEDGLFAIVSDIRKKFSGIIRDYDVLRILKTLKYDFFPF